MTQQSSDFEFLYGQWQVRHLRLKERLVGCEDWEAFSSVSRVYGLMGGLTNVDESQRSDGRWVGMSIRLFEPLSKQWSIYWVGPDGALQPPVMGRFEGGVGTFYGDEESATGRLRCRFLWSQIGTAHPRWEQALSTDDGQSWETNWIMEHTRL